MQNGFSLYEYIYQSLVTQIQCGVYSTGQKFPTQRQLCCQYHVGITTIRKVYEMLSSGGYIRSLPGQSAIITYPTDFDTCAVVLAGRRGEIQDAFQGLGLLMPALYTKGAKRCGSAQLEQTQRAIDGISADAGTSEAYHQANLFYSVLLHPLRNSLIMDLELDAENYLQVPYIPFPGIEDPFYLPASFIQSSLQRLQEFIIHGQFSDFYAWSARIYRETSQKADGYLSALTTLVPAQLVPEQEIHWFRVKARSELYAQLAMTLLRRIATGEFDGQKYLPSIPKLMEEYGVMKDTASRALALLNSAGFTRTLYKKGTVLATKDSQATRTSIKLSDPVIQQRLSLCLEALQIIALTVRSCAHAYPDAGEQWAQNMEDRLNASSEDSFTSLCVQLMMSLLIQLAPFHCLKNIYRQMNELLLWGYYLRSAEEAYYPGPRRVKEKMKTVIEALRHPAQTSLPEALEQAFLQVYQDIYAVIAKLPYDLTHFPSPLP